ncbi:hypothetical protein CFD26_103834 [Aspergillus turcosus]|uniref:Uncharacterized protein n=1 Tax=Aspergillus turcosus TaxID=1245748 RepID=A0A3R7IHI0_9EURO|nr:hypothetical protein CFD26_103834 [Aspergillus turcosus]
MDYAELLPTISAPNGPFLINPLDDWSDWKWYITGLARCLCVYEILVGKEPYPVEPTFPIYPGGALADGKVRDAAGNERGRPTAEQLATYELEWEVYEVEAEQYQRNIAALGTIWKNGGRVLRRDTESSCLDLGSSKREGFHPFCTAKCG